MIEMGRFNARRTMFMIFLKQTADWSAAESQVLQFLFSKCQKNLLDIYGTIYNYMVVDNLNTTLVALSDPTRRAILDRLANGPATVSSIAEPFRLSQQAISKHLAYLERAHLIEKRREGRQHFCALKSNALGELIDWAENCQKTWEKRFDRLDQVLESMKKGKRHDKK
jgi:DNA-binding transcriptional ArsR family regulator